MRAHSKLLTRAVILTLVVAWTSSCETLQEEKERARSVEFDEQIETSSATSGATEPAYPPGVAAYPQAGAPQPSPLPEEAEPGFYAPGSGVFVGSLPAAPSGSVAPGEVTLNFENTNIREVVKVVLGDLLNENYVIDPRVQGGVTLQTSRPLPRNALIPTLEMLLRMNEAALVYNGGLYNVVPQTAAIHGLVAPQLGDSNTALPRGYSVRIVPLKYIAATEMQKILEPFVSAGNIMRVDVDRNLLILAGTSQEIIRLLETVQVFDVDWLAGMSVALVTPDFMEARTLASELEQIFGDQAQGPLAGLVRLVPIERLNALLVITSREEYLRKVASWVERLDQDTGGVGQRLFVYHVQNGKAVDLADVLSQIFEREPEEVTFPEPELAPGLIPEEISSDFTEETDGDLQDEFTQPVSFPSAGRASTVAGEGLALSGSGAVKIIADEVNNALLIKATQVQYRQVQAALRQLDITPLQVLIETTIAEISLTDELRYGLEWFFKNSVGGQYQGQGLLDLNAPEGIGSRIPGFSYAILDGAGRVRAVLNALAAESKLNIISSPSLMVLNNQTATIQVGDEVPVQTQARISTSDDNAPLVTTTEYRDTGVLLSVTPRVNAGGLVTMEVEQEVSDVTPESLATDTTTPTIFQRTVRTNVAVQSGETVVLGGLIQENRRESQSGIPILYKLPLIGPLFGQTSKQGDRTELVVLITPRAVQDANEARQVTEEFRAKMKSLEPLEEY